MASIQPEVNDFVRRHQSSGISAAMNALASSVTNEFAKDVQRGIPPDVAKATAVARLAAFTGA